ncbi:MAG: hypothetical protein ACM3PE_08725 [Deltaproteobacteria bacterium]
MKQDYYSDGQNLTLKISGHEMNNGYNLYYVCRILSDFHSIIDKSYLTLSNKSKMSEKERQILNLRLISVNEGSFSADLALHVLATTQMALPFIVSLNPISIWEIVKQSYEYLKFVLEGFHAGESISIEGGENNTISVINGGTNNNIIVFPQSRDLAIAAFSDYQNLLSNIGEGKGVDNVFIFNKKNNTNMLMDSNDKDLFDPPTKLNEDIIEIRAEIYRVDGHSLTGRLKVISTPEQDIVAGSEYTYELENQRDIWKCAQALLKPALVSVRKEISFNPRTLDMAVSRLRLVSVDKILE